MSEYLRDRGMGGMPMANRQGLAVVARSGVIAPQPTTASSGSRLGTVLVIGALGGAGYLLYRHFKKKASSRSST